jgi:hypothetical protein
MSQDWAEGLWNVCECKNLPRGFPWTQQEEAEALQASDLFLISLPEWIERASQVTEEEYNANPFAEQLNEEFGHPFEKGLYHMQASEQESEAEEEDKPVQN